MTGPAHAHQEKQREHGWVSFPGIRIGGMRIATASRSALAEAMVADCLAARRGETAPRPRLIFSANGHALSLRETDSAYRAAVDQADVIHADGGFLVPASRLLTSTPIAERSATTDMIHDCAGQAATHGLSFYLLGGSEQVNAACARILAESYPGLVIAGRRHGYFSPEEEDDVVAGINAARPDVLWVGLGKPKEQLFSVRHRDRLRAGWLVTCGGCYNFVTGDYKRAPAWMRNHNLEWLHRMLTQPRKLFRRYLLTSPHALWLVLMRR
jgi:N-acetylglucosaminyldiphosphoundecaprenol N-acetyl-beta-D-mannosaminyltransferase